MMSLLLFCKVVFAKIIDGTFFHAFVDTSETLYVFNSAICRSLYVTYTGKETLSASNIPVYHFTPPRSVLASAKENPANLGYCTPTSKNCLGDGVLNISACSSCKRGFMQLQYLFRMI